MSRAGVGPTSRACFDFYNTLAEVDRLTDAIADVQRIFRRR